MGSRVWGLASGAWGLGFRVEGLRFRVQGLVAGLRVQGDYGAFRHSNGPSAMNPKPLSP